MKVDMPTRIRVLFGTKSSRFLAIGLLLCLVIITVLGWKLVNANSGTTGSIAAESQTESEPAESSVELDEISQEQAEESDDKPQEEAVATESTPNSTVPSSATTPRKPAPKSQPSKTPSINFSANGCHVYVTDAPGLYLTLSTHNVANTKGGSLDAVKVPGSGKYSRELPTGFDVNDTVLSGVLSTDVAGANVVLKSADKLVTAACSGAW